MKYLNKLYRFSLVIFVLSICLIGCSHPKELLFADRIWYIDNNYGKIIVHDTTYRMVLGNNSYPENLTIISTMDSVTKYPGMKNFIVDVLHTAELDSAQILFYAPHMNMMFVRPKQPMKAIRPSSLTSSINTENPYTMWTYNEYPENWNRDSTEMYTYTYYDKDKKRLLAIDWFDYGDEPIVQIMIWQTRDKHSSGMKLPWRGTDGFDRHDLKNIANDIEYWGHQLESRRVAAIENYRIGQNQRVRNKSIINSNPKILTVKADSCYYNGDYSGAFDFYKQIIDSSEKAEYLTLYNAACSASLCNKLKECNELLENIIRNYPDWYLNEPFDPDLDNLKNSIYWNSINDTINKRRNRIEANYDIELRNRLIKIRKSDQDIRHQFLNAYKSAPVDTILTKSLTKQMKEIDENNLAEIKKIIKEFGWPGKDLVGNETVAIWLVIQHSDIETQKWALPFLKEGAKKGDLNSSQIAMLEDRILVNSGQPQIYGTQFYWEENDGQKILKFYPIEDETNLNQRRTEMGLSTFEEEYEEIKNRR